MMNNHNATWSCQKAVETQKKQRREGKRGGQQRGARTEARCCRVHPTGPPGPHSQTSLCLTPWPHPKPSCLRTKTSGRCGGWSCLLPNPYLGAKGTRAENCGKRRPSPPHRLPAGRLGAVLARAFSPSWPLSWPAGWYFAAVSVPRSCVGPDDVIPLPQARCGEHGRSPGPQSLAGEEGASPGGTALVGPHPELVLGSQAEIGSLCSLGLRHEEQIPSCKPQLPSLLLLKPRTQRVARGTPRCSEGSQHPANPATPIPATKHAAQLRKRGETQVLGHGKTILPRQESVKFPFQRENLPQNPF